MSEQGGTNENQRAAIDAFHEHLEACQRCARNPFDLCSEGDRLIRAAVEEEEKEP